MNTDPASWTPDSELEKYAGIKHSQTFGLGDLEQPYAERARRQTYDLSFTQPQFAGFDAWRDEALGALRKGLVLPVKRCLTNQRILSRIEKEHWIHEEAEFRCQTGYRIPATVLVPKRGKRPFPAVVVLHDMGGSRPFGREKMLGFDGEPAYLTAHRKSCYEGKSICAELVHRGFLTISIDALVFGERCAPAWKSPSTYTKDRLDWTEQEAKEFSFHVAVITDRAMHAGAILTGQNFAGIIVQEDMATVDYLLTRDDVDPKRIGCTGLSFGAYRTNYLAALDERIKAAVSVCWMATLDSVIGHNLQGAMGYFTLVPGINTRLDVPDIASLACPRAFMAISGWKDHLMHPFGNAAAHRKLRAVWEKAGIPEKLGSLCFDAPHEYNVTMQERAGQWFSDHL